MNRNKRKNPYTSCDKCIAIKKAKENKDYKAYCEARGIMESVMRAEQNINGEGADEFLIDTERDFHDLHYYNDENKKLCPFEFQPKLKRAIRVKYRLKCSSCQTNLRCPAEAIHIGDVSPICSECAIDYGMPDYEGSDYSEY